MEPGANKSEQEKSEEGEDEGELSHFPCSRYSPPPPPPQLFRPTLPYLNALNRLSFQSVMINRAYFILLIFLAGHMKPTVTTTCQRENCESFFS